MAIAFSAGVDSTFLLASAQEVLGANVLAVTTRSAFFQEEEFEQSVRFCQERGIRHLVVEADVFAVPDLSNNPQNRCYLCKKNLFTRMWEAVRSEGFTVLAEGTNADDSLDYRPGMRAIRELGVLSPLEEAGLAKAEIRQLSKELGLSTWEKPSYACLATRIPYGEVITEEKLSMIAKGEQLLHRLGFAQVRVRLHGDLARIEILPTDMERFLNADVRREVTEKFHQFGFHYVSLDLTGYRTGSMNEGLSLS